MWYDKQNHISFSLSRATCTYYVHIQYIHVHIHSLGENLTFTSLKNVYIPKTTAKYVCAIIKIDVALKLRYI